MKILEGFFTKEDRVNLSTEIVENVTKEIKKYSQEKYKYFVFNILDYVGKFDGQLCCSMVVDFDLDLPDIKDKVDVHHMGFMLNSNKVCLKEALSTVQVILQRVPSLLVCVSISLDALLVEKKIEDIHDFYLNLLNFLDFSKEDLKHYFDDETNTVSYFNV